MTGVLSRSFLRTGCFSISSSFAYLALTSSALLPCATAALQLLKGKAAAAVPAAAVEMNFTTGCFHINKYDLCYIHF
jgi:hypothetical protein